MWYQPMERGPPILHSPGPVRTASTLRIGLSIWTCPHVDTRPLEPFTSRPESQGESTHTQKPSRQEQTGAGVPYPGSETNSLSGTPSLVPSSLEGFPLGHALQSTYLEPGPSILGSQLCHPPSPCPPFNASLRSWTGHGMAHDVLGRTPLLAAGLLLLVRWHGI